MSEKVKRFVLGFLFDARAENVMLIEKARPIMQAGKFNGLGGKVEAGESPLDAMAREFREETDSDAAHDWSHFAEFSGPMDKGAVFHVDCFAAYAAELPPPFMANFERATAQKVEDVLTGNLPLVENVPWLVAMARDHIFTAPHSRSSGPAFASIDYNREARATANAA